jgi:hypothetical protein
MVKVAYVISGLVFQMESQTNCWGFTSSSNGYFHNSHEEENGVFVNELFDGYTSNMKTFVRYWLNRSPTFSCTTFQIGEPGYFSYRELGT